MVVGGECSIDLREADGVVDKEGHAPTVSTPRTILPEEGVTGESWIFRAQLELSLLEASDLDIVRVKVFRQRLRTTPQTVTVPLDDGLGRRRRRSRARMRVNSSAK